MLPVAVCQGCDDTLPQERGNRRKFCSDRCRKAKWARENGQCRPVGYVKARSERRRRAKPITHRNSVWKAYIHKHFPDAPQDVKDMLLLKRATDIARRIHT